MIGPAPKCTRCLWYDNANLDGLTCKAYPRGISDEILLGEPHDKVRPDQEGDFVYVGPDAPEE